MYVHVCVFCTCMYECVHICMYVCMHVRACACMYVCRTRLCVFTCVCMCVCVYIYMLPPGVPTASVLPETMCCPIQREV